MTDHLSSATDPAAPVFLPALSHPLRAAIVDTLISAGRKLSSVDLKQLVDSEVSLSRIQYHLKVLVDADLITEVTQRQVGNSTMALYAIDELRVARALLRDRRAA